VTARRRYLRRLIAVGVFVTASSLLQTSGVACPSCPTSRAVAAIVCGSDVWRNLACIVAPFPVMALVAWRLHGMGRRRSPATTNPEG
jgi:hypothetical protein